MKSTIDQDISLPKSKIKVNCILSDSYDEFNLEVSNRISIKSLKRRIHEKLQYQKGKGFNVIYNEKDLTNFNKLKLSEVFSRNPNEVSSEYFQTECNSQDSVRLKIIPRTGTFSIGETKLKYMLECPYHLSENAHYYCIDCLGSFCSLCIEEHTNHDFLDKYDYSKSNEEIVNDIMKNFLFDIQKKQKEMNQQYYMPILLGKYEDEGKEEKKMKELSEELMKVYEEYCLLKRRRCEEKLKEKSDDFKESLNKFKMICLNNLAHSHNKKGTTDIIALDDDYFKDIHQTLNELKIGKEALMNYLQVRNDECINENKDMENFNKEIMNDMEGIRLKIKNKLNNIKGNSNENDDTIKANHIQGIAMNQILEEEFKPDNGNTSPKQSESMLNQSILTTQSNLKPTNLLSKFIMKRKLIRELFIYNTATKAFSSKKTFKADKNLFKRFLLFSVFINIKDILYISGGKTKEEKCVKDFYCYFPQSNTLHILPSMLHERCSHSMIHINTSLISNEIFCIGGYSNNTCERYSIPKNKWFTLPNLISKEKQVSTLVLVNGRYLYSIFGFSNNCLESPDYAERIDIGKLLQWEMIPIDHSLEKYELKKFNVGLIPLTHSKFLLLGGEQCKAEVTDSVYTMIISEDDKGSVRIDKEDNVKLPLKCSFIDKQFVEYKEGKFAQFEMKKNNMIFYNRIKNTFKVKAF